MPASSPGTVELQRVLRAPPERVYRAFVDPAAMVKWLPPHGFTGSVQHSDVRVGGSYRMAFSNFAHGGSHAFGGTYLELVPGARIRYNDQFEDPALPGTMEVMVTLAAVAGGTELRIVQTGIPAAIALASCHLGWQESLALLALLVEADMPQGA